MKNVTLSGSWIIKAPRLKIYEIISDFENAPKYFPSVSHSMKIHEKKGNHLIIEATTKTLGMKFKVRMKTELLPPYGFKSINESGLAIEDETFSMEEVPEGTEINYTNHVEIKNNFSKPFSSLIIGKPALKFWEREYINKLRTILE
jgi:carbon monoxide dehydrogenase subunit G